MTDTNDKKNSGIKALRVKGEVSREDYFDFLNTPLDNYDSLEVSEAQKKRIRMHLIGLKTGVAAFVPLFCGGSEKCPFALRCPFSVLNEDGTINEEESVYPLHKQCPVELELVRMRREEFIEEYDLNPNNSTDLVLVNKLCEIEVYEYRINILLAIGDRDGHGQDLMKETLVNVTPQGVSVYEQKLHPLLDYKNKLHRQRLELLNVMVGTRREKYKKEAATKKREDTDVSTQQAALRAKINKLTALNASDADKKCLEANDTKE